MIAKMKWTVCAPALAFSAVAAHAQNPSSATSSAFHQLPLPVISVLAKDQYFRKLIGSIQLPKLLSKLQRPPATYMQSDGTRLIYYRTAFNSVAENSGTAIRILMSHENAVLSIQAYANRGLPVSVSDISGALATLSHVNASPSGGFWALLRAHPAALPMGQQLIVTNPKNALYNRYVVEVTLFENGRFLNGSAFLDLSNLSSPLVVQSPKETSWGHGGLR